MGAAVRFRVLLGWCEVCGETNLKAATDCAMKNCPLGLSSAHPNRVHLQQ